MKTMAMVRVSDQQFYYIYNNMNFPMMEIAGYDMESYNAGGSPDNTEMDVTLEFNGEVPEHLVMCNPVNKVPTDISVEVIGKLKGNIYEFQGYLLFTYEDRSEEREKLGALQFNYNLSRECFEYNGKIL